MIFCERLVRGVQEKGTYEGRSDGVEPLLFRWRNGRDARCVHPKTRNVLLILSAEDGKRGNVWRWRDEAGVPSSSDMSDSDPEVPDPRGTGRLDADEPLLSASGGIGLVGLAGGACAVLGGGYASLRPGMMPTSSAN